MDDGADELLAREAWELYAVPPAGFVAARTAAVKRLRGEGRKEEAKEVAALRRPSVAAAAVNALVRAEDPVAARLRDLGTRMRHAQSALDAAGLAALRGERDEVLAAWVRAAGEHAPGAGLTAAVEAEVRDTAVAALADAGAAEVALSGTLTRGLSYSGFGEVDVADAVARTSTGVVLTRIEGGAQGTWQADAEEGGDSEEVTPAEEEEADEPAEDEEDEPVAEPDEDLHTQDDLAELRARLEDAEAGVSAARTARRAAADEGAAAGKELEVTLRGLEQARALLAHAEEHHERARRAAEQAAARQEEAESALVAARRERDAARTALEEAEDA